MTITCDTNVILKLDLGEDGGMRRIPLKKLWNNTTNQLSFQNLVDLILTFTKDNNNTDTDSSIQVMVSYTDMDGDLISVSTDDELLDAFEQCENQVPPVLRAKAHIKVTNKEDEKKKDDSLETRKKNKEVKKNLVVDDENPPIPMTESDVSKENPTQSFSNIHPIPTNFDPEFVHGRHTCYMCGVKPIVGYRYHAINIPHFLDLCQICVDNYVDSEIEFKPMQFDGDVSNQSKWKQGQKLQANLKKRKADEVHSSDKGVAKNNDSPDVQDEEESKGSNNKRPTQQLDLSSKRANTSVRKRKNTPVEAKHEGEEETITIRVKDQTGEETFFKIKKTTKMSQVFKTYASRKGVPATSLRFVNPNLNGESIVGWQTAEHLGLDDLDEIFCLLEQLGC